MRSRISANFQFPISNFRAPFIGTFHAFGARILRDEADLLGRTRWFTIFDDDDALRLAKKIIGPGGRTAPGRLISLSGKIKGKLLDPAEFLSEEEQELFHRYEASLAKMNAFDFDDLIEKAVRLFEHRPETKAKYQSRFRHILVDEYQDVNPAQYELVRLLASAHRNLSVVGDDAQAIYGWRHADFKNFLNFERDWPGARVVVLDECYRSSATIIRAASAVIASNLIQHPKELWTKNPAGDPVYVVAARDSEAEAAFIASAIKELNRSASTAVLYRTNAQSRSIEQGLIGKGIPYRIFGGMRFYERAEVKDVIAGVRLAVNPRDEISKERLMKNLPVRTARAIIEELQTLKEPLPPAELIRLFLATTEYLEYLRRTAKNPEERIQNVEELLGFAEGFRDAAEFLERVTLMQATDQPNETLNPIPYTLTPVSLMTIHLAKGLEFDRVFVAGVSEGLLPHQMSYGSREGLEEERRLMYVAMTRARKTLSLSFTKLPSRFLYEIPPELTEFIVPGGEAGELPEENIVELE